MHRSKVFGLAMPFLMVVACQDHSPTGVSGDQAAVQPDVVASHGQLGKPLPIQGKVTGGVTNQIFAPSFPVQRDTFGGRCSVPSDWVIEFTLGGPVSHLGEVTAVLEHCSQVDLLTGTATYGDGTILITTANGDELWGTYNSGTSGPVSPEEVWFQDAFVYTGGTGRFANASGSGTDWGTALLSTFETHMELRGWISYEASDRRN